MERGTWDFGDDDQYPVLKAELDADDAATWQEFGYQLRERPELTATGSETRIRLSWTAVTRTHWSARPAITYVLYRGDTEVYRSTSRSHTDRAAPAGQLHQYQVVALANDRPGRWSDRPSASLGIDYDTDDNNLIDVDSLAKLNAIRWDLDGDGDSEHTPNDDAYGGAAGAFTNAAIGLGCPVGCTGYELTADLDFDEFDTDSDDDIDSDDTTPDWYDVADGWAPLGDSTLAFTGVFDGKGHTISNLFIERNTSHNGLFGAVGSGGAVKNLGLAFASVTATGSSGNRVGVLVGDNAGDITAVYATGAVSGRDHVGGLVGRNVGAIETSYAAVSVTGRGQNIGGLTGFNGGGSVTASYATGAVAGGTDVGGLAGENNAGTITNSYATGQASGTGSNVGGLVGRSASSPTVDDSYFDTDTTGRTGGIGRTTAQVQAPTDATASDAGGVYENWSADNWHFGTDSQYPALEVDFDGDGAADDWDDFGYQLRERPVLTATGEENSVDLSWTSVTDHWTGRDDLDVEYAVYRGSVLVTTTSGTSHSDTAAPSGVNHQYRVSAAINGGAGSRSVVDQASRGKDYDADEDNLIEITTQAQLDAVRHDLRSPYGAVDDNSNPATAGSDAAIYAAAFDNAAINMGCAGTCAGYELAADLDLSGEWTPVGEYNTTFDGNGYVIRNLTVNVTGDHAGLFTELGSGSVVRGLGLPDANVRARASANLSTGALAGYSAGTITNVYATGIVRSDGTASYTGGLVGRNNGGHAITGSYAVGQVRGTNNVGNVGGLVGQNNGGTITNSYATGPLIGSGGNIGGLVGRNQGGGSITASYFDRGASGRSHAAQGKTAAELQMPTDADAGGTRAASTPPGTQTGGTSARPASTRPSGSTAPTPAPTPPGRSSATRCGRPPR